MEIVGLKLYELFNKNGTIARISEIFNFTLKYYMRVVSII